jgi:hypothetical protein
MERSKQKKLLNQSSIKIKFVFILILSNACMFLLSSTSSVESYHVQKDYNRIDYVKVKIYAELMTEFSKNEPFKITNLNRTLIINNVYIISKVVASNSNELSFNSGNQRTTNGYIVYLHKSHSLKLLNHNQYRIYPQSFNISKKSKRRNYEIIF